MKRILFCLFFTLCTAAVFCQQNILFRESYDAAEINEVSVKVYFENIYISEIKGEQIVVEISSNNSLMKPIVSVDNSVLKIDDPYSDYQKGDSCSIYVYIPKEFPLDGYKLESVFGSINIDNLKSKDFIDVQTSEYNNYCFKNLKTEYLHIKVDSELSLSGLIVENLDCSYFNVEGFVGDIHMSLIHAPQAQSQIRVKEGKIFLDIPSDQNFDVETRSTHSFFINNFEKSKSAIRDGKIYKHNNGGALIKLQTFKGDITIGE